MATPAEPVIPRPRKPKADVERPTNGHDAADAELPPPEPDATDADLADWSRGAEALARMPPRRVLQLTESIPQLRQASRAALESADERIDRFRWEPLAMLESGIGERLGAHVLSGIPTEPPAPLLIGRLDPEGHTILYGTGGVGKGTLAASWANGLLEDGKRILIVDYENHPSRMGAPGLGLRGRHR